MPASSWPTQQIAEFLAAVSTAPDEERAIRTAVERAAETVNAEVGALVRGSGVVACVGYPRDAIPVVELVETAHGERDAISIPGVGPSPTLTAPLEGAEEPSWLVLVRGGERFDHADSILLRSMARVLVLSLKSLDLLERERSAREESERFAYVASHDLSEPLTVMAGYADLLEQRYGDQLGEDGGRYVTQIGSAAARMRGLIDDLLAFSRAGTAQQEPTEVDVGELVDEIVDALGADEPGAGIEITAGPLPPVVADRIQLGQLFQNLISNAVKYTGDGPVRVVISARETPEGVRYSVADNGIGFPSEDTERIFEMFRRLHSREEYAGTGIGLAICRRIAERHGGRIWAESEPGVGSTFHLFLPREADATRVAHDRSAAVT